MRFLADMGVSQRVVSWLRNEGHDALHVREENLLRLPNGLIFEKAYSGKAAGSGLRSCIWLFRTHD